MIARYDVIRIADMIALRHARTHATYVQFGTGSNAASLLCQLRYYRQLIHVLVYANDVGSRAMIVRIGG